MTIHVHLIVRAEENNLIQDILRDLKNFTSKAIIKTIIGNPVEGKKEWLLKQFKTLKGYRFWRADNHPVELWSNKVIDQKLEYMHQNPVEQGFVSKAEHYLYSSAAGYDGEKGL